MSRSRSSAAALFYLVGSTPWVIGKSLAIASPALLRRGARWAARCCGACGGAVARPGVLESSWSSRSARRRALVQRAGLPRRDARAARAAGRARSTSAGWSPARDRRSSTSTKPMPTGTSCVQAAPVEPAEYRPVTLPLRDGALLTKSAWARPRLVPALHARALPLDRHAPLARGKPPAVDLPARAGRAATTSSGSVPAASADDAARAHTRSANPTCCPTAATRRTRRRSDLCSADPVAVPPLRTGAAASPSSALGEHAQLLAYQRPRADRPARGCASPAGPVAPRAGFAHARRPRPRARPKGGICGRQPPAL